MNQATQPSRLAAPTESRSLDREREAYRRAAELLDRIVGELATLPRQAAVVGDLTGFCLRLNFGTNEPKGVLEFAEFADVPATRDENLHGVWMEARANLEGVPVCAEVLLSVEAAAVFEQHNPPPAPGPDDATPPAPAAPQPMPLGASVTAYVPAVPPVQSVHTEQLDSEDTARCVRCGCTEDQACEGGCYWVSNQQMADLCSACATPEELQVMAYTAEISDGGE
ncbi:hypothetical protein [Streptomyces sediminimaris]|uniref:hypothetical protein n=1 Tax=Streptomyces sediminimaris TaxID=3383721 RepID=UPI00399AA7CB